MQYTIDVNTGDKYDVIVCGGGTAGVFAAISAARQGMKVLMLERTFSPGGMLTLGNAGITKFTEHCKDVNLYKNEVLDVLAEKPEKVQVVGGLPKEYAKRMIANGTALGTNGEAGSYVFTDSYQARLTLIEMLEEADVTVLYDTRVCLANTDKNKVVSVVVDNKDGFTEFFADVFIDATGDGDLSALAGVPFHKGASEDDVAENGATYVGEMQHSGVMYRVRNVDFEKLFQYLTDNPDRYFQHEFGVMSLDNVIESYRKGEMCVFRVMIEHPDGWIGRVQVYNLPEKDEAILLGTFCGAYKKDGVNALELSQSQHIVQKGASLNLECVKKVPGFENAKILHAPDVGVRETRHIEGEYRITPLDLVSGRDFEDSIACGGHPVDIHPVPDEIKNMNFNHWRFHIPYRIMLPKNCENIIVAGRCVSASRIAIGAIRPTAQCMAMGEAAGVAASLAVKGNVGPKNIDVSMLRKILTDNGAII